MIISTHLHTKVMFVITGNSMLAQQEYHRYSYVMKGARMDNILADYRWICTSCTAHLCESYAASELVLNFIVSNGFVGGSFDNFVSELIMKL